MYIYIYIHCHLRVPIVLKSGNLNLLEPSGPGQACNGIPFTFYIHIMEQLRKLTVKRKHSFVYFPLFMLAVYAILMGYMKADNILRRLFTWITLFFLLPVWLFRDKGCTNYRKRDTRKEFMCIVTNEIKSCCTGRIRVIDR